MKIRVLSACIIGVVLAMSPLVQSAPGNFGMQAAQFKVYYDSDSASSFASDGSQERYARSAQAADNLLGAVFIKPGAQTINRSNGDRWYVICIHPENGGEVSANKLNGGSRLIQVALDPANPRCRSLDVVNPVVIDITEYGDGAYRNSLMAQDKDIFSGEM